MPGEKRILIANPEGAKILKRMEENKKKLMKEIKNDLASWVWKELNMREIL